MANRIVQLANVQGSFLVYGARYGDQRGFFEELYNEAKFETPITASRWKQVSLAQSKPNVLRGLHCSNYAKYVTCVRGEVFDVVVDLRPESPTYLKHQGVWLNADDAQNPCHLYVPKRCGHGYFCKRDSLFLYLQDGTYNPSEDIEVNPFDETVKVAWPLPLPEENNGAYIVSDKDRASSHLKDIASLLVAGKVGPQYREILSAYSALPLARTKLLLYGHKGFLGGYFLEVLQKLPTAFAFNVVLGQARLEDRQSLVDEIGRVCPDRIVCMAGIAGKPDISWCEKNPIETIRVNLVGQLNVLDVASSLKPEPIHCTVLTSGGIYEYDDKEHAVNSGRGFTEEDEPNFHKLFYYQMRISLERLLHSYPNALNLRIMYPTVGDLTNVKSLVSKLIKYEQIKSIPISISMLDDLWPVAVDMVQKGVLGTFNFNNPGTISHDQILQLYKEHVNSSHVWKNVPFDSSRPAAELSAAKLLSFGYKVPNVYESIKTMMINASKKSGDADNNSNLVSIAKQLLSDTTFGNSLNFKNILITGGAGFIASHVAILLCKKYKHYNIIVYDILDSCSNIKNLESLKKESNFKFIKGDICDFDMVRFVMEEFKIDCVMHFAAQSHVDISLKNSLKFTEANVKGTHVLLESARQIGTIKRFVHVSTDEVYGTTGEEADINQALEPTNPYACSKLAAECIIKAYQRCFKMPILISRCNNVYGPHQFIEKVIPKFIMRLLKDKKCCVHDDGSSERDFLYVNDVANAFDLLLHKGLPGQFYNIGASKGIKIKEVAVKLIKIIKEAETDEGIEKHVEYVQGRVLDDKRYKIDSTHMTELGWSQKIDFDEGLRKTVEWYKTHMDYWSDADYALEPHPQVHTKE